jgi:hypothetical protein
MLDSELLLAENVRLQAELAVARKVLKANLSDFNLINDSSMWHGHPFNHAVRDIIEALATGAGERYLDLTSILAEGLREVSDTDPSDPLSRIAIDTLRTYRYKQDAYRASFEVTDVLP